MRGSKLQRDIQLYLEAKGHYVTNVIVAGKSGTSDLIACIYGFYASIEVKGTGDTIKKLQEIKAQKVQQAGGYAIFAHSLKDVKELEAIIESEIKL